MAKITISNADLVWIFTEKLKSFRDVAPAISIAIVPNKGGWTAIASRNDRNHNRSKHHKRNQTRQLLNRYHNLLPPNPLLPLP